MRIKLLALCAAALVMSGHPGRALSEELRVLAANAVKEPLVALAAQFERATGHKVTVSTSGTEGIVKRITSGEPADVVIVGSVSIDRMINAGALAKGSSVSFAKVGIGVAVRAGAPRPDISTSAAVKTAILDAKSIAYSSGPSGEYIAALFGRLGVADQVKSKLVLPPPNLLVGEVLARGDADLGFQQTSDLVNMKGIDYLGPLPSDIQNITVYAAALHAAPPSPVAAQAFMKFFTTPEAALLIKSSGMDPP